MKKTLLLVPLLAIALGTNLAFAFSITPSQPATIYNTGTVDIHGAGGVDNFDEYYSWWTTGNIYVAGTETLFHFNASVPAPSNGTYKLRLTGSPTGGVYPNFPELVSGVFTVTDPPLPPAPAGIPALLANATSSFATIVGFTPADSVGWQVNNLLKPLIGGGLSLLYVLRYVLIAVLVIWGILMAGKMAFRFFKQ